MIVVRIYEGLGNQMFEYAYAYSLSKEMEASDVSIYLDMRPKPVTVFAQERMGRPLDIKQFNITMPLASSKMLNHWFYIEKPVLYKISVLLDKINLLKYKVFLEKNFNYISAVDYLKTRMDRPKHFGQEGTTLQQ